MDILQQKIKSLEESPKCSDVIIDSIMEEASVYPFNTEIRLLAYFQSVKALTYNEYVNIIKEYSKLLSSLYPLS